MRIKLSNLITIIVYLASTIMLAFTGILGMQITRFCLYIIVGCMAVELFLVKLTNLQMLLLALISISSLLTHYLHGGNIANTLIFITSIIFAMRLQNEGLQTIEWRWLKGCTYVVMLSYAIMYFGNPRLSYLGQLLLFFDNPNMAGIACCAPTLVILIIALENRGKRFNIINWALLIMGAYLVYCTQNRGSLITLLLSIAATLFVIIPQKEKRFTSKVFINFLILMPIVVMVGYVILYEYIPHDILLFNKPLFSGRESAWAKAIESMIANPFAYQSFESGTLNLVLEGISRYGVMAMVSFFAFLFSIKKDDLASCSIINYIAYFSFFISLFQQSFESTMITGSYSVYIWTYSLLGIANMRDDEIVYDRKKEMNIS